jgi:hypothetical protein
MKITESQLRSIIKQELARVIQEVNVAPMTAQERAELLARIAAHDAELGSQRTTGQSRERFKKSTVPATPEDYANYRNAKIQGSKLPPFTWKDKDGKYWKEVEVTATEKDYDNSQWSGTAGSSVYRVPK